jgi:3-phytase
MSHAFPRQPGRWLTLFTPTRLLIELGDCGVAMALLLGAASLAAAAPEPVTPRRVTEPVEHDSDDPAIWVNRQCPAKSLVLGVDKDVEGAIYVFDLQGRSLPERTVTGLNRPNNIDVVYDVALAGQRVDLAVVTERYAHQLRIFRLPELTPVDGGGAPVFVNDRANEPMGIALDQRERDDACIAFVSRSELHAPREGYLHQYQLADDGSGVIRAKFERAFGTWSGKKEIEAVAVDPDLGFVYYSDEGVGVRKYPADPSDSQPDQQLALFATAGFAADQEGISLYRSDAKSGYLLVSDQSANAVHIFPRAGTKQSPHDHPCLAVAPVAAIHSDGNEVAAELASSMFPGGLLVMMSEGRTFQYYAWQDLARRCSLLRQNPLADRRARPE